MMDISKLATPAFLGFSLSVGAFLGSTIFSDWNIIFIPLSFYGVVIVVIEAVKNQNGFWQYYYGFVLSFIWSFIVTFAAKKNVQFLEFTDRVKSEEYIDYSASLGVITLFVCMPALFFGNLWEANHFRIREKCPKILNELSGNHVAFVTSAILILLLSLAAYFDGTL